MLKGATMTCLKLPAECLCLFSPRVNLSEGTVLPLSQSHKYERKGINKSKLLAGLSSAGLVQFTFLLYGYIYVLVLHLCQLESPHFTAVPTPSTVGLAERVHRPANHMTHGQFSHVRDP